MNATPVMPPTKMAYIMARGVSLLGDGISSVMWQAASKPMRESALCRRPRIQAVPLLQPVSLRKFAKTKEASFLEDVARMVMLITTTARIDQYTVIIRIRILFKKVKVK